MENEKEITEIQFKALHVWFRQCEAYLNKSGFVRFCAITGKRRKWGKGDFKYYVWKPFIKAVYKKDSTKDHNTIDAQETYLAISAHLSTQHGWLLPSWPSARG
jgi:hypothetical protein